jgi:hypothetical protein
MRVTYGHGRLTWFCDACATPIRAPTGYLIVSITDVFKYQRLHAESVPHHDFWQRSELV